ncbi:MAG: hypothetical protein KGI51_10395 [Rhodospirillales bacterium]|nr:hypothetical protein [Rhodospirillales bacterium]
MQHARYDIVDTLAGPMAEAWQRMGAMGPYVAKNSWVRETLTPETSHDHVGDLLSIRRKLRWLEPADPGAEMERLWRATMALLQAEWPGIVSMGRALRDRVEMAGGGFEDLWRQMRPSPEVRARRLRQQRMSITI